MWNEINVWQYQQIFKIIKSDKTGIDRSTSLLAIVNNMTEKEVDDMSLEEFTKDVKKISFLNTEMPKFKPLKTINVNGKRYKVIYDVRKMPFARYIESKVFADDLIGNMHKLLATMVIPMKKKFGFWVEDKYDSSKHGEYAQDMLEIKFAEAYASLVFFYHVYRNLMEVSRVYLIRMLCQVRQMEWVQAEEELQSFLNTLDGSIQPNLLPSMKIAKLRKHINLEQ